MWFIELLTEPSIAQTLLIYAFTAAVGVWLGNLKVGSVSLGVSFVLFVGIVMGHFGFRGDPQMVATLKNFGLILFIFSIGLQVGPSFISTFKHDGRTLNAYALGMITLNILITVALFYVLNGKISFPMIVGIMTGATTNTPGLGAAQEALKEIGIDEPISLGYAIGYPVGVIGAIIAIVLLQIVFKIKIEDEDKKVHEKEANDPQQPCHVAIKITNQDVDKQTIQQCRQITKRNFIVSQILHHDAPVTPSAQTVLAVGDSILVICSAQDKDALVAFFGKQQDAANWQDTTAQLVSRRLVITQDAINGKTLKELNLRATFGINITEVTRSGVKLLVKSNLVLLVGDKISIVGAEDAIKKAEPLLGNALQKLDAPPLITLFLGIFLGIIVGYIPIHLPGMLVPVKLGLAGGPLVVSMLIGAFGHKIKLTTYTTQSALLMIRQIGISLFLASVGLEAGEQFFSTVASEMGIYWMLIAFAIVFIPLVTIAFIARKFFKMNFLTLIGLISGSTTNSTILAYVSTLSNSEKPALAYSATFPLALFLRIISAQILVLLFA